MNKPPPAVTVRLDDEKSEVVRRNHDQRLSFIEQLPAASLVIIPDVSLADGVETTVSHTLGRRPKLLLPSPPRGAVSAGYISEVRTGAFDRNKTVVIKASGYGATIAIDLGVL